MRTWCGSPPYAAPELFEGKQYDAPRVDVWVRVPSSSLPSLRSPPAAAAASTSARVFLTRLTATCRTRVHSAPGAIRVLSERAPSTRLDSAPPPASGAAHCRVESSRVELRSAATGAHVLLPGNCFRCSSRQTPLLLTGYASASGDAQLSRFVMCCPSRDCWRWCTRSPRLHLPIYLPPLWTIAATSSYCLPVYILFIRNVLGRPCNQRSLMIYFPFSHVHPLCPGPRFLNIYFPIAVIVEYSVGLVHALPARPRPHACNRAI